MKNLEKIFFHEATILDFQRSDDLIQLKLEDVMVNGQKSKVFIIISTVIRVIIDGEVSKEPLMSAVDGEVIDLSISESSLKLIVEWNDFLHKKHFTKSYEIFGNKISLSVV